MNAYEQTREAMEKIREKCVIYNNDLAEEIDAICGNALAAPARNCDLFDNWYDAHQAWERLPKDKLGYFVDANGVHECEQACLLAPAAKRKGEGDGSK